MSQIAERYYEFLEPEEALSPEPILKLDMAPEPRRILYEAQRRMIPFLRVIAVQHLCYDGKLGEAQMVVHHNLVDNIQQRFANLRAAGFAIEQMLPHLMFDYKDDLSMAANNTSCQRPDFIGDPKKGVLSKHFAGVAVDIEPEHNRQRERDGRVSPPWTPDYVARPESMLMYLPNVRQNFSDAGFEYGGTWPLAGIEQITGHPDHYPGAPADEHHFEIRDAKLPSETHLLDMRDLDLPDGIIYEHPGILRAAFAA
jgi:hypothetical protein